MLQLEVKKREIFGKKVKSLVKEGFIPAEIYGHGFENIHVSLSSKDFGKVFKEAGESSLVTIAIDGKMFPVLIHEIKKDVLGDRIIHVDLYRVRMDEKIKTQVPLRFIGESSAVKEKGGVLVKSVEEVEVEALPSDLPHSLEVDISKLTELHQNLHGSDIIIPKGVKVFIEPEMGIVTVMEPQKEEIVETPAAETSAGGAEGEGAATATTEGEGKEEASKQK